MHSETLLSLFLPVLPTLLRSYPTGQAERKAARKMQPDLEDVLSTLPRIYLRSDRTQGGIFLI